MVDIFGKKPAAKLTTKRTNPAPKVAAKTVAAGVKPVAGKPAAKTASAHLPSAGAAAKTARKPAGELTVARTPVKKPPPRLISKAMAVSAEQRYRMVAEAAYYRAEANQFKSDPLRDWIDAESDIAALLSGGN